MEERKRSFEPPRKCLNLNAASELGIPWVPGGVQIPQLRLGGCSSVDRKVLWWNREGIISTMTFLRWQWVSVAMDYACFVRGAGELATRDMYCVFGEGDLGYDARFFRREKATPC